MTKNELAEKIARELNVTVVQGKEIIGIILDEMKNALVSGKSIQLRGLGSFIVKERQAMKRKHPGTGKIITIPKQKVVRFIPGKSIKKL
ncbi:HU family DNA-binding protein [Candidatus Calescamantes bacterium]|nr:HU family DNA-binding protein [bacterium]MCK5223607.1 HU family DNA-binding protein [Candidatus Calescamantes bacterium]MCK5598983.1 HU family DNA-binding protein [bacterium]